ncbi:MULTISPECIES: sugar O-acetyltransferase [Lactococcus]|uniref:sugar O-acetyltransferase n=1 Tax=Lactococcus TaxID=1357 RepID=UPI001CDBC356|nr:MULTISPECIES: sugar O-acetyltransferase [Lactococcus]MCA2390791.1 sugar O-acetyltransferase [Lactococcus sp. NH2-7C]MCT1194860.1 sugar O-acetyltransferase [Lactococcus lactis]WGV31475.1 sugar O-acetyltransferase [Lactococcus sp. NH2-7C]
MSKLESYKRVHTGELYFPDDQKLWEEQQEALAILEKYNQTSVTQPEQQTKLLKEMFSEIGEDCFIQPPFYANFGGKNVHFGTGIYANFNLTLVDDTDIFVGNHVMFGPNVTIDTATHPVSPDLRKRGTQYNKKIYIEENVWLGAGVIVLPGVRIGKNSVIGAGSIVTKDIPDNVVAFGTPCVVKRKINDSDFKTYDNGKKIDLDDFS